MTLRMTPPWSRPAAVCGGSVLACRRLVGSYSTLVGASSSSVLSPAGNLGVGKRVAVAYAPTPIGGELAGRRVREVGRRWGEGVGIGHAVCRAKVATLEVSRVSILEVSRVSITGTLLQWADQPYRGPRTGTAIAWVQGGGCTARAGWMRAALAWPLLLMRWQGRTHV